MGGKSRKSGGVSKKLIAHLANLKEKGNGKKSKSCLGKAAKTPPNNIDRLFDEG